MKLLVVLSLIACGYAAKLDRTYLPPASASTAGGSPGSLNAPPSLTGPSGSVFGQGSPIQSNTAFGNAYQAPSSQYNQPAGSNLESGFGQPAFGNQGQSFGNQAQDYQRNQPERARASEDRNAQILRSDSQNDGETFSYSFETSNGISAEESGVATNGVQAQGAFSYSDDDGQSYRVVYTADENGYQPQGDHLPTPHPIPEDILKSIEQNARAAAAGTQEGAYNPEEDNAPAFAPQQYNNNAPTSYGQASAGQSAAYNQPGQAPELYAAPNAAPNAAAPARSQGNAPPSQLYGAPSGSPSRPSGPSAFKQTQAAAQQYNAPAANARPNTYSQNQAPSGPSNNFAPSGSSFGSSANQGRPTQYQASPSSQFGRPQGVQAQDESGYQYNRPQAAFGRGSNNASPSQGQFNSQNGAQGSRPQGFGAPAPARSQGFGAASGQGSYGPAAGARPQSFAPSAGPSFQGSPAPKGNFGAQPSYGSPAATPSFGAAPSGSSFGPSNGQSFGKSQGMTDSGYQYNRPQAGNQRPQGGFNGAQVGLRPQAGSNGPQGSAGAQNGFKAGPQPGGPSFEGPRQPPSFSEDEGYKY